MEEPRRKKWLASDTVASWLAIRDQEGLTYDQLAERSAIATPKLMWWQRRLRRMPKQAFAKVEVKDQDQELSEFVVTMRVQLRCGHSIELGSAIDQDALSRVAKVLESC